MSIGWQIVFPTTVRFYSDGRLVSFFELTICPSFYFYVDLTEIDIPADIDIPQDDADVDAGEAEAARKEEQKWTDLDLDVFRT
jgi:hypothetical protein